MKPNTSRLEQAGCEVADGDEVDRRRCRRAAAATPYCERRRPASRRESRRRRQHTAQERQRDHDREDARRDQPLQRIGAERAHGVELLGHRHAAQLGGDARADAPADHQRGEDRRQLAQQRRHRGLADVELGAEALEAVAELERQHHAGERRHGDGEARASARRPLDLVDDVADAHRRRPMLRAGAPDHQRERADAREHQVLEARPIQPAARSAAVAITALRGTPRRQWASACRRSRRRTGRSRCCRARSGRAARRTRGRRCSRCAS